VKIYCIKFNLPPYATSNWLSLWSLHITASQLWSPHLFTSNYINPLLAPLDIAPLLQSTRKLPTNDIASFDLSIVELDTTNCDPLQQQVSSPFPSLGQSSSISPRESRVSNVSQLNFHLHKADQNLCQDFLLHVGLEVKLDVKLEGGEAVGSGNSMLIGRSSISTNKDSRPNRRSTSSYTMHHGGCGDQSKCRTQQRQGLSLL
jgi:hypothetical protein